MKNCTFICHGVIKAIIVEMIPHFLSSFIKSVYFAKIKRNNVYKDLKGRGNVVIICRLYRKSINSNTLF